MNASHAVDASISREAIWAWLARLPFEHHLRQRDEEQVVGRWRVEAQADAQRPASNRVAMLLDPCIDRERWVASLASWAAQTTPSPWAIVGSSAEPCPRARAALGLAPPLFAGRTVDLDALRSAGVTWCLSAAAGEIFHPSLAGIVATAADRGSTATAWERIGIERDGARLRWTARARGPGLDPVAESVHDLRGGAYALPLEHWRTHVPGAAWRIRVEAAPSQWFVHPEPLVLTEGVLATTNVDSAIGVQLLERTFDRPFERHGGGVRPVEVPRRVSVVVLYRDRPDLTIAAVDSIEAQRSGAAVELVLVDNGSSRGTCAAIDARLARGIGNIAVERVDYPGAFNHSLQCALGAARASGEVLLFLNNDARLTRPDAIDTLARWAALPRVATVGARLVDGDRTVGGGFRARRAPGPEFNSPVEEEAGEVARWSRLTPGNSFACAAVSRTTWDRYGMDSRRFPIGYNDVDFCLRATRGGLVHVNLGDLEVEHRVGASRAKIDEIAQKLALRQEHGELAVAALAAHDVERLPPRDFAAHPDFDIPRD